jgi:hypothetical protein
MESKLKEIYALVNDWLKFAEAKNGVLIGFIGGAIFGVISNLNNLPVQLQTYLLYFFIPSSLLSLVVSMISFLPILGKPNFKSKKIPPNINLLYFGHLRLLDKEYLVSKIYESSKLSVPETISKFELDIAQQIIINSNIARYKYLAFRYATCIILFGLLISLVLFGIY